MTTPVDPASGQILRRDQFHAAIKAAQERFSLIRKKHPRLKGYLVISLAGGQTGIGSSEKEILKECPTLAADDRAKSIHSLKVARPFTGMYALRDEFSKTLANVRAVGITPKEAGNLVRHVTGWPDLPENPKSWERAEQTKLDADLETA